MPAGIDALKERGKDLVRELLDRRGYVIRTKLAPEYADFSPELHALVDEVTPYTQTPPERIAALANAVEYVIRAGVPGAFVECGVWRGGSMMVVAKMLRRLGVEDRELWLYDTYEGMTAPTEADVDYRGESQLELHRQYEAAGIESGTPPGTDLDSVRAAMTSTGYPTERVRFVKGPVEQTIPADAPQDIAILRLDTDWYESTRHELVELYPRLASRGVLIIDDYGHFAGSRRAVDEYFAQDPILLNRTDYGGRIAVKTATE
jgi:O-methyltransferase